MTKPLSTAGLLLAGTYSLLCLVLIATQGLFGESFIALLLGLPWSMLFAFFEFGNASGPLLYTLLLAPLVLNAFLLYGIGILLGKKGLPTAVVATAAAVVVLVGGFYAFNSYIYAEKQGDPGNIDRYRGTLTGTIVCLPHADTTGPQTKECAFGMRTDTGEHYAVDFSLMSQENPGIDSGDRFSANGLITPIEMLSTDHWRKYDIEGIFSVTDSVKKL